MDIFLLLLFSYGLVYMIGFYCGAKSKKRYGERSDRMKWEK